MMIIMITAQSCGGFTLIRSPLPALLVAATGALLCAPLAGAQATTKPASTIADLPAITVIGSTASIKDATGKTISVDPNPYGVVIAPSGTKGGLLKPGDVVVSNFGANDTGTTLVRFAGGAGPGILFGKTAAGPAAEAFNSTGNDWVANFNGNNVQIFSPQGGAPVATITSPLFKRPWGQAFNGGTPNPKDGSVAAFFSTNFGDGTIDRIDVVPASGKPIFRVFQIGKLPTTSSASVPFISAQGMAWVPRWVYYGQTYHDVLLVVDPADNRIAAYPDSSSVNTTSTPLTDRGITVFEGAPLNTPAGLALNPLNGDLLVVNQADNNLIEIGAPRVGDDDQVVAVRTLDKARVNPKTGAGSALFGIAATTDAAGNLTVYFTDDNTNTLDVLSAATPSATSGNSSSSSGDASGYGA
jgi:hypothetical protein